MDPSGFSQSALGVLTASPQASRCGQLSRLLSILDLAWLVLESSRQPKLPPCMLDLVTLTDSRWTWKTAAAAGTNHSPSTASLQNFTLASARHVPRFPDTASIGVYDDSSTNQLVWQLSYGSWVACSTLISTHATRAQAGSHQHSRLPVLLSVVCSHTPHPQPHPHTDPNSRRHTLMHCVLAAVTLLRPLNSTAWTVHTLTMPGNCVLRRPDTALHQPSHNMLVSTRNQTLTYRLPLPFGPHT